MKTNHLYKALTLVLSFLILTGISIGQNKTVHSAKKKNSAQKKVIHWFKITPVEYFSMEDIITDGKKTSTYYESTKSKPVKVVIQGPAKIKFLLRIGFSCDMKGVINYRLIVRENKKTKNTYQISANNSVHSLFKTIKELTPSVANQIEMVVPEGTHTYEIYPIDKNHPRLFCRILQYKDSKKKTSEKPNVSTK